MSTVTNSPGRGLLKFVGALIISSIVLSIVMFLVGTMSPGSQPLGAQKWMTGAFTAIMGMIIGISATYAPNPLDNPEEASSQFTNLFEWVGLILFFGGMGLFFMAQAGQFKF